MMKNTKLAILLVIFACLSAGTALGATFSSGETYYLQPGNVVNDNLYAVGGSTVIAGTVNGDAMVAGGTVMASGSVSGDMTIAGGNLDVSSSVAGDLRAVGGNIIISKSVGGEVVVAGGQVSLLPGVTVAKDAAIAGGSVYIDGTINGNLRVAAEEIKLGPAAVINGNFEYYSKKSATLEQGAVVRGATNFHKVNVNVPSEKTAAKNIMELVIVGWIIKVLMMVVAVIVLLYFFKPQAAALVQAPALSFWREVLRGLIVLVVVPIAVILSFITAIGLYLGLVVLFFYIVFILIASVLANLVLAQLCMKYLFRKENYPLNWWIAIIAVLAMGLIALIPFVGWIFVFVIFLSALGSTSNFIFAKLRA